jgi:hypothetical protein
LVRDRLAVHCSTGFTRRRRVCPFRLPGESASFAGVFVFAVAFMVDGVSSSGEDVVRCDVADGAVQADGVVQLGNTRPVVRFRAKLCISGTRGSIRPPGRTGRSRRTKLCFAAVFKPSSPFERWRSRSGCLIESAAVECIWNHSPSSKRLALLRRRIETWPDRISHRIGLMKHYFDLGQFEPARTVCAACIERWPDYWWSYLMLAKIEDRL